MGSLAETAAVDHKSERLRIVGELTTGLAHDLNQSLGLIAGYTELCLRELERGEFQMADLGRHLELVHRAALSSSELLTRVLRFATNGLPEPAQPIDLGELLADVVDLTALRWRETGQAEGRPIDVRVQAVGVCLVSGSRSRLQHTFMNLIFNAIEALPNGGSICIRTWRASDCVEVEVSDSGYGMSPEVQARIFEPFFTTRGTRGFGLGLAQIWQTVDEHGGSIEVESAPGEGTTFRIKFPHAGGLTHAATQL